MVNLLSQLLHLKEEETQIIKEYLETLKPLELKPEELEKLSWISYTTKQPATAEEAAWTFTSEKDGRVKPEVEPLLKAINQTGIGRITVGDFEYRLSGDGRFIQRRPLK